MRDDFEVVWNGGSLLPERDSQPDPRWNGLPVMIWEWDERVMPDPARARLALRKKRLYNKQNRAYWAQRSLSDATPTDEATRGVARVRHRSANPAGSGPASGAGTARRSPPDLLVPSPDSIPTTTRQEPPS